MEKEIKKKGQYIETEKVVTVTDKAFSDDKIELELDGGGKNKKSFVDRIQVGVGTGNTTTPVGRLEWWYCPFPRQPEYDRQSSSCSCRRRRARVRFYRR